MSLIDDIKARITELDADCRRHRTELRKCQTKTGRAAIRSNIRHKSRMAEELKHLIKPYTGKTENSNL